MGERIRFWVQGVDRAPEIEAIARRVLGEEVIPVVLRKSNPGAACIGRIGWAAEHPRDIPESPYCGEERSRLCTDYQRLKRIEAAAREFLSAEGRYDESPPDVPAMCDACRGRAVTQEALRQALEAK